jgi:hypothetical protein
MQYIYKADLLQYGLLNAFPPVLAVRGLGCAFPSLQRFTWYLMLHKQTQVKKKDITNVIQVKHFILNFSTV